jgi:nitric oxide reductase NorQ protein
LPEVLKSSFCGRFSGRWDDATTDSGAVWAMVQRELMDASPGASK